MGITLSKVINDEIHAQASRYSTAQHFEALSQKAATRKAGDVVPFEHEARHLTACVDSKDARSLWHLVKDTARENLRSAFLKRSIPKFGYGVVILHSPSHGEKTFPTIQDAIEGCCDLARQMKQAASLSSIFISTFQCIHCRYYSFIHAAPVQLQDPPPPAISLYKSRHEVAAGLCTQHIIKCVRCGNELSLMPSLDVARAACRGLTCFDCLCKRQLYFMPPPSLTKQVLKDIHHKTQVGM